MATAVEREMFEPMSFTNVFEDNHLHTPTRFLLNCLSDSFTPSFSANYGFEETNPFEHSFNFEKHNQQPQLEVVTGKPPSPGYPSPVVTPPSDPLPIIEEPAKPPVPAKTTVFKSQGPENFETPKGSRGSPKYKTLKHRLVVEENDDEEDLEVKRLKFLERNRQAALKCRQKKKLWEQELQERSDQVEQRNKELRATVQQLKEEALALKSQLLAHTECDCTLIRDYLTKSDAFKLFSPTSYSTMPNATTNMHMITSRSPSLQLSPDSMTSAQDYSIFSDSSR